LNSSTSPTIEQNFIEWYVPDGDQLIWEHFDESSLLFNPRSGCTHALEQWTVDVLQELMKGSATVPVLAEKLGLKTEEQVLMEKLQRIILALDDLGLILPVGF
jgi:PqqD family protein of HPr-rel-A system